MKKKSIHHLPWRNTNMYLFNNYYVWDIFLGSDNAEINETTFLCLKTEMVKETNN